MDDLVEFLQRSSESFRTLDEDSKVSDAAKGAGPWLLVVGENKKLRSVLKSSSLRRKRRDRELGSVSGESYLTLNLDDAKEAATTVTPETIAATKILFKELHRNLRNESASVYAVTRGDEVVAILTQQTVQAMASLPGPPLDPGARVVRCPVAKCPETRLSSGGRYYCPEHAVEMT